LLGKSSAKPSFSSEVSNALNQLAAASASKSSKDMTISLEILQKLNGADSKGLDEELKLHLLEKSKHGIKCNPIKVVPHMRLLAEANPLRLQKSPQSALNEQLNQFHADLMRRLEVQYSAAFD
jgi:hypothetical protein